MLFQRTLLLFSSVAVTHFQQGVQAKVNLRSLSTVAPKVCPQNSNAVEYLTALAQNPNQNPSETDWPLLHINQNPTEIAEDLQAALDCIGMFNSTLKNQITADEITTYLTRRPTTPPSSLIFTIVNDSGADCIEDIVSFVTSIFFLVIGDFLGLDDVDPDATVAISKDIAESVVTTGASEQIAAELATGAEDAEKIAKAVIVVFENLTVPGIIEIISHNIHWYDWLFIGITLLAQVVAIVTTDGASLVFDIIGWIASGVSLAQSVDSITQDCFGSNTVETCGVENGIDYCTSWCNTEGIWGCGTGVDGSYVCSCNGCNGCPGEVPQCSTDFLGQNYCDDWCNKSGRWGCGVASDGTYTCDCSGCGGCP